MAKNQDPSKKLPEGTPSGKAGEEKLILGKYKTMEEAEKGEKEREAKFTLAHQELADTKRKLEEREARLEEIETKKAEKEKEVSQEEYKVMTKKFIEDMREDPYGTLDKLIRSHPSVANRVTREDLKQKEKQEEENRKTFEKFRKAHKEDFDKLTPKMGEIWDKLPPENRRPEMLELVYKAAKAESLPDEAKLREKIIEDMKAGHSEGGGEASPGKEEKDKDSKDVDKIIEAHKKEKVF